MAGRFVWSVGAASPGAALSVNGAEKGAMIRTGATGPVRRDGE